MIRPCSAKPGHRQAAAKARGQAAGTDRRWRLSNRRMALMGKKRKVHSLTGRIDDRLMMQSFKAVKRNRGNRQSQHWDVRGESDVSLGQRVLCPQTAAEGWIATPRERNFARHPGCPRSDAQEVIRSFLSRLREARWVSARPHCHIERLLSFHEAASGSPLTPTSPASLTTSRTS